MVELSSNIRIINYNCNLTDEYKVFEISKQLFFIRTACNIASILNLD